MTGATVTSSPSSVLLPETVEAMCKGRIGYSNQSTMSTKPWGGVLGQLGRQPGRLELEKGDLLLEPDQLLTPGPKRIDHITIIRTSVC